MKPNVTKTVDDEFTCIMNHCQNIFFLNTGLHDAHMLLKDMSSFIETLAEVRGREGEQ